MATLSAKMIYDYIDMTVVGQEEAKKVVSIAIFTHYVQYFRSISNTDGTIYKSPNTLLTGPSGSGKTFLIRKAVEAVTRITGYRIMPIMEVDTTSLTPAGIIGNDMETLFGLHYGEYGKDEIEFSSSIVFLDEIDKICTQYTTAGGVDHNKQTQYSLLKAIEGTELVIEKKPGHLVTIDTSKMLFVLAGNFAEMRKEKAKAVKKSMGFTDTNIDKDVSKIDIYDWLQRSGMATQLIGRIDKVAELKPLDKEGLMKVYIQNILPEKEELFKTLGLSKCPITEEQVEDIVEEALRKKVGARGLESAVNKALDDALFNITYNPYKEVTDESQV